MDIMLALCFIIINEAAAIFCIKLGLQLNTSILIIVGVCIQLMVLGMVGKILGAIGKKK